MVDNIENNKAIITRERIKSLDIVGYINMLCNLPNYLKVYNQYIDDLSAHIEEKGSVFDDDAPALPSKEVTNQVREIVSTLFPPLYKYNYKHIKGITFEEKVFELYTILLRNITLLNELVKYNKNNEREEYARNCFDLDKQNTYLTEYENKSYNVLGYIKTGEIDLRVLNTNEITFLAFELGELLFFRELATGKKEELEEININERLDLLSTYFEPKTEYKTLSIRGKASVLEKIMGETSEWLRKKISERLRAGKD